MGASESVPADDEYRHLHDHDPRVTRRNVPAPRTWRQPYRDFVEDLPRPETVRRVTDSMAILSNRQPNERFRDALNAIRANRLTEFKGQTACDADKLLCADAIYALAGAMRYAAGLNRDPATATQDAIKLRLEHVDLSFCTAAQYRYDPLGYTVNPCAPSALVPYSHVRARLPLSLGDGRGENGGHNDQSTPALTMFQAAQILVARAPDNTVNIMLDNGEFIPAVPSSSCTVLQEHKGARWMAAPQPRRTAFAGKSDTLSAPPAQGSVRELGARVAMGRRKDHAFFEAGASARARLVPMVSDVKVAIPPGSIVAKLMIELKSAFGTRVVTVREIIQAVAAAAQVHHGCVVRLNDAKQLTDKESWWDQQKRCFVFLVWIADERAFLNGTEFDQKADKLKALCAKELKRLSRQNEGTKAGKGMGASVFDSDDSVTLTPKDHEGVVYTVPLRYLLANVRRAGLDADRRPASPFYDQLRVNLERRQSDVLAAMSTDVDVAEAASTKRDEYDGIVLDERHAKNGTYEESVYDVWHPGDGTISHNTYRLGLQLKGSDAVAGASEGGWCTATSGIGSRLDRIELDAPPIGDGGEVILRTLRTRSRCVLLKESKSATAEGPMSYVNPAVVTPHGLTKDYWQKLGFRTIEDCEYFVEHGKIYMRRNQERRPITFGGEGEIPQDSDDDDNEGDTGELKDTLLFSEDESEGRASDDEAYDTDMLMAYESGMDQRPGHETKPTTESKNGVPESSGSWVRVMPSLERGDRVTVRDYANVSMPTRVRIVNDNTYDVLLSDGEKRKGVQRQELWLSPELELKLSGMSVELLQENEETYDQTHREGPYPPDPMPVGATVLVRCKDDGSPDGIEGKRINFAKIVERKVGKQAAQMPGDYHDVLGLIPNANWEYTVCTLPEKSSATGAFRPNQTFTRMKRGFDIQAFYPLPAKEVLLENDITALDASVFLRTEFRPSYIRLGVDTDELPEHARPSEPEADEEPTEAVRYSYAQFDMQTPWAPDPNDVIGELLTRATKAVHPELDVRGKHFGNILEDPGVITAVDEGKNPYAISTQKRYTVRFQSGIVRDNVPPWELWPTFDHVVPTEREHDRTEAQARLDHAMTDSAPPSQKGSFVRVRKRSFETGKTCFRYYCGIVDTIVGDPPIQTFSVRVAVGDDPVLARSETGPCVTFDVGVVENIQTIIDLPVGQSVLSTLNTGGFSWARYLAHEELKECTIEDIRVPRPLQNRWLPAPSSVDTAMAVAQGGPGGLFASYDYDVELLTTGEVLRHVDPMDMSIPLPGARVAVQIDQRVRSGCIACAMDLNKPLLSDAANGNEALDFCAQIGEELIPPELSVELPSLSTMLDLNLEDPNEGAQNSMPRESAIEGDRIGKYRYIVELDQLVVRDQTFEEDAQSHRGLACSLLQKLMGTARAHRLHGKYVPPSPLMDELPSLPIILLVHPSGTRGGAPSRSSSFLDNLRKETIASQPAYRGEYNPIMDERAYQVGSIVTFMGEYFVLESPENKLAPIKLNGAPGDSWKPWQPMYDATWSPQGGQGSYTLRGPYVGTMPGLFGDMVEYEVGKGVPLSASKQYVPPNNLRSRIDAENELHGARPRCKFQVWEFFNGRAVGANTATEVAGLEPETCVRAVVSGADFMVTSVDHGNEDSVKSARESMNHIRALGGHFAFVHERGNELHSTSSYSALDGLKIEDVLKEAGERGGDFSFRSVVWKHKDSDPAPMACFVQPPAKTTYRGDSTITGTLLRPFRSLSQSFAKFLWVHGALQSTGVYKDAMHTGGGYCIDIARELWCWESQTCFMDPSFVARCALRRVIDLCRSLCTNRIVVPWQNTFVLEGPSGIWERTTQLVTPYGLRNIRPGLHAWVKRSQHGTVMCVNDGTYDVKRDTAKALRALEAGADVTETITVPASDVEAVRTLEAHAYDKSALVELFIQGRNSVRSVSMNFTDLGLYGARALKLLIAGDLSPTTRDFYYRYSTFKVPINAFLRPQPLVTTLCLRACGLGAEGLEALAEGMKTNESITSLDLGMNSFGDNGIQYVSQVMAGQPSLKHLDLSANAITGVGASALARGIAQFQIGVVIGHHPAMDLQLQDKKFLGGVPFKAIVLKSGDKVLVSRETRDNLLHCTVIEIDRDGSMVTVKPEGYQGSDGNYPVVDRARCTLPWSYLKENHFQVRIAYERKCRVKSLSKRSQQALVQYLNVRRFRLGEVRLKPGPGGNDVIEHIATGETLGVYGSDSLKIVGREGVIEVYSYDDREELWEMVPWEFLRNPDPASATPPQTPNASDSDTGGAPAWMGERQDMFNVERYDRGYKSAIVIAPQARVLRATEAFDVKMFDELHPVVASIPAARCFTQPSDKGEYVELSVPRCRMRSLVGSYVGLGATVEVQPRGRVCRLESLVMDENDVADLLVTKGFGRMDGLIALMHAASGRSTMERLSLRSVALGDRGATIIAKTLSHPHNRCHGGGSGLSELDVSQCQILEDGLRSLVAMAGANSWIKRLVFQGNPSSLEVINAVTAQNKGMVLARTPLDKLLQSRLKDAPQLRKLRPGEGAHLAGAGTKADVEKEAGEHANFFPTAFASVVLGHSLLPRNAIDIVNVQTGIRFEDEIRYRYALTLKEDDEEEYRKYSKELQQHSLAHMRRLKKQCHDQLAVLRDEATTSPETVKQIEYCVESLIVSGRLTNPAQVQACCAYFIAHHTHLNDEARVDKQTNVPNRSKVFSIGAMERACGLRDQLVELNQNDGTSVCEGNGTLPWYALNLKIQRRYTAMKIDNSESDWIAAVDSLETMWREAVGTERIGPKPFDLDNEDEEEEVEQEPSNTAKPSDTVAAVDGSGSEKDAIAETPPQEAIIGGAKEQSKDETPENGDPTAASAAAPQSPSDPETLWYHPVAYFDNLNIHIMAFERKRILGPVELESDDAEGTLFNFGVGTAMKYDIPLFVNRSDEKVRHLHRINHERRVGAAMASLLKRPDQTIEEFLKEHGFTDRNQRCRMFGEKMFQIDLKLCDLSKIVT